MNKKYLAIVEKPSLCKAIKDCYLKNRPEIIQKVGEIDFIALAGHVCTWLEPNDYEVWEGKWENIDYPMSPKVWDIKAIDDKRKKELLVEIKNKVKSGVYDGLINCCDSDTEGTGIFWLVVHYLKLEDMEALRFMEHSLTEKELKESLLSMKSTTAPEHLRSADAFLLRSQADWLYGMNATRMMTVKLGELMTVGRVKAPTIKMIYDNSMAIENFEPERYLQMEADYGSFRAVMVDCEGKAQKLQSPVKDIPLSGVVEKRESKTEYMHAPRLYDLTSIQAEAGQSFGYAPSHTLALVQSLYEEHKLISYPRTQCRYVSIEKAKEFPMMLQCLNVFPDLCSYVQKIERKDYERVFEDRMVVNDEEVAKEAHDALLPTEKEADLSELSEEEIHILKMIYTRLLAQFLPPLRQEKSKLITKHGEYSFMTHGKIVSDLGWRKLYGRLKDIEIPNLYEGNPVTAAQIEPKIKETAPPKRITQATLIYAMQNIGNTLSNRDLKRALAESQGIGTPATRAAIIKDIIDRGYAQDKRGLYITEKGKRYVEGLKDIDIIDPVFAAKLDMNIKKIQRGEADFKEQYQMMIADLKKTCKQIDSLTARTETNIKCHLCGTNLNRTRFSYKCPHCNMKINKFICGVEITEDMLMDDRKLSKIRKFKSKKGNVFEASLKKSEKGLDMIFKK